MGLQNNFWEFDFFRKKFFYQIDYMKELIEKVIEIGVQSLKT